MGVHKGRCLVARHPYSGGGGAGGVKRAGVSILQEGQHSGMGVEGGMAKTKRLWESSRKLKVMNISMRVELEIASRANKIKHACEWTWIVRVRTRAPKTST